MIAIIQWTKEFTRAILEYAWDHPRASFSEIESAYNVGILAEELKGLIYDIRFNRMSIDEAVESLTYDEKDTTCTSAEIADYIRKMKIQHPRWGKISFDLYDFQRDLLVDFNTFRQNIVLKSRQMGISTLCMAYAIYYADKNPNSNICLFSYSIDTAKMQLRRAYSMCQSIGLSFGKINNKHEFSLANGSQLCVRDSNFSSPCASTIDLVILDEAAYIPNVEYLWVSLQQVAYNGKIIVHSSPDGTSGWFYDEWNASNLHRNKIVWYEHPDRDSSWRQDQDLNLGIKVAKQECDAEFI